jgi:multidrug efflux pump subunit AcrB
VIGIVKKNAIMLVDFAITAEPRELAARSVRRARGGWPILISTMAAMLGCRLCLARTPGRNCVGRSVARRLAASRFRRF